MTTKEKIVELLSKVSTGDFEIVKLNDCYESSSISFCWSEINERGKELSEKIKNTEVEEELDDLYNEYYSIGLNYFGVKENNLVFKEEELQKLYDNKLRFKEFDGEGGFYAPDKLDFHTIVFYDNKYLGFISDLIRYYFRGIRSFDKNGVGRTEKGYAGWTHRGFMEFKVGDKIKYNDDLIILSHGYMKGCSEYDEEEKEIQKIRDMFKDGVLEIKDLETAKILAERYSDALS